VLLVAVIVAGLVAEVFSRIYLKGTLSREYLQRQVDLTWLGDFTQPHADPELVYELKPGVNVNWRGVRVVTASDGSRRIDPERKESDESGVMKIAILGDSSSFGWLVDFRDSYGEVLQRLLQQSGRQADVRNFSVPGYNSQQARVAFMRHVLPWKPHFVIVHHDFNDADPINAKPVDYMAPDYGDNVFHSVAIKWASRSLHQLRAGRDRAIAEEDSVGQARVYRNYRTAGPLYDRHLRELETIAREAAAAGIRPIAFVHNPWIEPQTSFDRDPFYTFLHVPVVRALRSYGYTVIDSYPLYQRAMAENGWTNLAPFWVIPPADAHPSPLGHAVIARALFEQINSARQP
jgi:lysophospholipase L1-like esterase